MSNTNNPRASITNVEPPSKTSSVSLTYLADIKNPENAKNEDATLRENYFFSGSTGTYTIPSMHHLTSKSQLKKVKKLSSKVNAPFILPNINTTRISKALAGIFKGAILFWILALIFPQLKEVLPEFYTFIEGVLWCFNKFFGFVVDIVEHIIGLF